MAARYITGSTLIIIAPIYRNLHNTPAVKKPSFFIKLASC